VSFVIESELGRRNVVASAPLQDFLLAVLLCSLSLVEALKGTIVPLVQSPGFVVGDEKGAHLLADSVVGLDSALQDRRMSQVELKTVLLEELTSSLGFFHTLSGEVDIMPACEAILEVPCGLSVADEDNLVECGCSAHRVN